MIENEIQLLQNAYNTYNLNNQDNINKKVLEYIKDRILKNRDAVEELINIKKEKITFNEILNIFNTEEKNGKGFKKEKTLGRREDGFIFGTYTTSIGKIAVETSSTKEVISYFIKAINSRNAIAISDLEYDEQNVKALILLIFSEALAKFNIDKNLIMILPYEECYYERFDRVIFKESNRIQNIIPYTNNYYIYLENEEFTQYVNEDIVKLQEEKKHIEILKGSFENVIDEINKEISYGVAIYTKDIKKAYKFINLIHSKNVFINATLLNVADTNIDTKEELYMNKNIMYELDNKKQEEIHKIQQSIEKENLELINIKENKWYTKIFNKIKELFHKK